MSEKQPYHRGAQSVVFGLAPGKYDSVAMTYDANGNLLTATFSWAGTDISKITLVWSGGNLVTASVGTP